MIVSTPRGPIFYTTSGRGPACLVPSAIGTPPYERMIPVALQERLRLVFVDLRGGGRSEGDAAALTFDDIAADLDAVRRDLGLPRVAVMGHSILGLVAIEYGRRCAASVSHVVAVGAPPVGDMAVVGAAAQEFFARDASEERKSLLRANLAALPADATSGRAMLAQAPMRFYDPRQDAAPLFAEAALRPVLLQRLLGSLTAGWDVRRGAFAGEPPLLLVHGRYDYVVPPGMWDGIPPALPRATLVLFAKSSHHPFVDEPDRFAATVADWITG